MMKVDVLTSQRTRSNSLVLGFVLLLVLGVASVAASASVDPISVEDQAFFEARVRPVLVERCLECHSSSSKSLKGGLRLDSAEGWKAGGESGPVIEPGRPQDSLLIEAVRYEDPTLRMPPKGKLPEQAIADLTEWVRRGAPDPRGGGVELKPASRPAESRPRAMDLDQARRHWAYQPLSKAAPPSVRDESWPLGRIDRYLLAALEARGLAPSPEADRPTLIRRLTLDLTGLPPSPEAVEAFTRDPDPAAYERLVDRLLADPAYGERWGRHWLDVARYADTKDGVLMYGDARLRPYAYTYRDYVIRAWNDDTPFDRFIHEQLAADLIRPEVEPWRKAAMGFLTLGRMFDSNIHDVIDDRIDTTTRGFLGLTVACARCHDHKYDAIGTSDYYALYGVFAGSESPLEPPLIEPEDSSAEIKTFEVKAKPFRDAIRAMLDAQYVLLSETARKRAGDYLVRAATTPPDPLETAIFFMSLSPEDLRPQILARWRRYLEQRSRPDDPVFGLWGELIRLPESELADRSAELVERWLSKPRGTRPGQLNPLLAEELARTPPPKTRAEVARFHGDLLLKVHGASRSTGSSPVASDASEQPARDQLLAVLTSQDSPCYFPKSQTDNYMSRSEKDSYRGKIVELDKLVAAAPRAAARAMVMVESESPHDPRIFVRGNPSQLGDPVPRRFLRVLAGAEPTPFAHGGGRLDLAEAITAEENPLTRRVIVNRLWMHHFGEPLAASPSDFGARGAPPSHPELLDDLAAGLERRGWSIKTVQRAIVLSRAYRQSSVDRPECHDVDPDNRLLWRFRRVRLDLEAMRDTLLAVSGRLDRALGGRSVDVAGDAENRRRTVYGLVDRQSLPASFRAFDFASPDVSVERRPFTTVPQQALFGMNAPFVVAQARALATRPEVKAAGSPSLRVRALYRLVLARPAEPGEVAAALDFLAAAPDQATQLSPLEQFAQVLLLTNELMFVD